MGRTQSLAPSERGIQFAPQAGVGSAGHRSGRRLSGAPDAGIRRRPLALRGPPATTTRATPATATTPNVTVGAPSALAAENPERQHERPSHAQTATHPILIPGPHQLAIPGLSRLRNRRSEVRILSGALVHWGLGRFERRSDTEDQRLDPPVSWGQRGLFDFLAHFLAHLRAVPESSSRRPVVGSDGRPVSARAGPGFRTGDG
jgi:hypothetical protein